MAGLRRPDRRLLPTLGLRRLLITLFVALGASLCLAVASQLRGALADYREAVAVARSSQLREHLAATSLALNQERTDSYLALLEPPGRRRDLTEERRRVDAAVAASSRALSRLAEGSEAARIARTQARVAALRQSVDAARSDPDPGRREAAESEVLEGYGSLADDLLHLRVALLSRERQTDPEVAASFRLRVYDSLLLDNLSAGRALIAGLALKGHAARRGPLLDAAEASVERAQLALDLLDSQSSGLDGSIRRTVATLVSLNQTVYRPLARQMLAGFADGGAATGRLDLRWEEHSGRMLATAAALQDQLSDFARVRIEAQRTRSLLVMGLWGALLLVGVGGVVLGTLTVVRRVIRPLEGLREAMLAVAGGDLEAPLPQPRWRDEIAEMSDTLRVFKANALRRARLQEERLALHERLEVAYRQLRRDVEAAAAVQAALLPAPARLGGVRFQGRLRPSHLVSGDSFDVLRQPNGAVHFFLVDVAGHGAASALVSVASHYTLAQAIQRRGAGEGLAEVVAAVNRDWPDHLTYFTLVLGELRPDAGEGTLVQAGHPSPLLLRRAQGVEQLGRGGLPIGILRDAGFEEIRFPFCPGDRLLLYSDGLTEAEDARGHPFGEERLLDLLGRRRGAASGELLDAISAAVAHWRGADGLDDDMTLLMLEATDDEHDRGTTRSRPDPGDR